MNIRQNLVNESKYDIKCPYEMNAEFIVVHNTANDASAEDEIKYMISNNNKVSFHHAVDDKEVVQGIPEKRNTWNAGDGVNGDGNRKGISIEICYSKSGGDRFIQAEKNAAEFIALKLKEKGWGIDKVKKHQDFSNKYCPHRTLDMGWDRFLNMVKEYMGEKVSQPTTSNTATSTNETGYLVKINTAVLNVRAGAGTKHPINTTVKKGEVYTIVEETTVGNTKWGKLKSGAGWISLAYTTRDLNSKNTTIPTVEYYKACNNKYTSLVDALNSIGVDSSYNNRKKIAQKNNVRDYAGTAQQNNQILSKLKAGKLKKA